MPTPKSTEALIKRTISACQAAGMVVSRVDVSPDGTVKVFDSADDTLLTSITKPAAARQCDEIFGMGQSS